jgi:hypothetical protein
MPNYGALIGLEERTNHREPFVLGEIPSIQL